MDNNLGYHYSKKLLKLKIYAELKVIYINLDMSEDISVENVMENNYSHNHS